MVVEMWLDRDGVVRLVFDGYAETWDDANSDIVALMCSTMLATMRRCEQESELNVRATHDPLTRLLNRGALHQRLAEMLAAAPSGRLPVVLFADLNHFKQLNDRFGHREGDIVLCRAADAIAAQVRPDDVAARIGGDEFVVVFGDGGGEVAVEALVQRVRSAVDAALAEWPDVTVAVGAIAVTPGDHPEDVLDRADRAMYADKARLRAGVGTDRSRT
jgi:diguanylate cyclase (GGDEF)-like protein